MQGHDKKKRAVTRQTYIASYKFTGHTSPTNKYENQGQKGSLASCGRIYSRETRRGGETEALLDRRLERAEERQATN
jgi:hypothetical protein